MEPRISIVMPVYNAEAFLADAIGSLQAQTFREWELIAVNDGSTDGSGQVLDTLAAKDSRIRVLHRENCGISATRNAGMAAALGEYVGFMDADDRLHPALLQDNYRLIRSSGADWLKFGKIEVQIVDGRVLSQREQPLTEGTYCGAEITRNLLKLQAQGAMSVVWNSLVSRQTLINSGIGFDTAFLTTHEDVDFCERLAGVCQKLVVNPKCYYYHCARPAISISSRYSEDKLQAFLHSMERSNLRYRDYGIDGEAYDPQYLYVMTKQVVANACHKLNEAGRQLTGSQKRQVLKMYYQSPVFARYLRIHPKHLWRQSKKLYLYALLFRGRQFRLLLCADKLSRKLVYWIRRARA